MRRTADKSRMFLKISGVLSLIVALVLGMAVCGMAADKKPIKVGVVIALSGFIGYDGKGSLGAHRTLAKRGQ